MKDFEPIPTGQDNKVISAEQRQVKTEKHIAKILIHPGHKCFEFDLTSGEIHEAKIESVSANMASTTGNKHVSPGVTKKIIQRENCLYCNALNKKNALKKFIPMYARLKQAGKIITTEVKP